MPQLNPIKKPYKSPEQIARLDERVPERDLNDLDEDDLRGIEALSNDPNFESELEYDGYSRIEEYDNSAMRLTTANDVGPKELKFEDREEDDSITEENYVDPQQNKDPALDPNTGV